MCTRQGGRHGQWQAAEVQVVSSIDVRWLLCDPISTIPPGHCEHSDSPAASSSSVWPPYTPQLGASPSCSSTRNGPPARIYQPMTHRIADASIPATIWHSGVGTSSAVLRWASLCRHGVARFSPGRGTAPVSPSGGACKRGWREALLLHTPASVSCHGGSAG